MRSREPTICYIRADVWQSLPTQHAVTDAPSPGRRIVAKQPSALRRTPGALHAGTPFQALVAILLILMGLTANTELSAAAGATSSNPPTISGFSNGVSNQANSPPSGTIAANKSEVLELTNTDYQILNSKGRPQIGTEANLFNGNGFFLSDPQAIWDTSTSRFYISMYENRGASTPDEGIAWGFSKTSHPSSPKDFCTYFDAFNYGATSFPDRQSLGDTSNFLLIGSNRYATSNEGILGSDVAWIAKPPSGSTSCPKSSAFQNGVSHISNPDGSWAYTPTPARQVDASSTGWIAATTSYVSASTITVFSVTKNASNGSAVISAPKLVPVPEYSFPPSAPQAGKTIAGGPAPSLETRIYLTQLTEAYDPRVRHSDLWTAHTIAGGAGSEVRWYEINPVGLNLDQVGTISDPKLWVFNATITPDRVVIGNKSAFGGSAVVEVNTSSTTNYTAIQMASAVNGLPESGLVMVKQSGGTNADFSCFEPSTPSICRWGDYSGSVPDPNSPLTGSHGEVWLVNQWNIPDTNDQTPVWQTSIWKAHLS